MGRQELSCWLLMLVNACVVVTAALAADALAASPAKAANVHTVFLTDCTAYSDWQSVGMVFSWKQSGQPGTLSKVMCCTPEEAAAYNKDMLKLVKTHIAPSFTVHPRTHDVYAAYNKPEAVVDWLQHEMPEEEWVVVCDSDMLLRRPFLPEDFNMTKGWAIGARYDYMIGTHNELADRHIPEIPKRNDTLAGPAGRRGDKVGGFFFMHRDDLKRLSTLWLKYTEDVRFDPEAWRLSGDSYATHKGDKPWISEMYGYSFGAAKADVWHKWDEYSMIYPGYVPSGLGISRVIHYGLLYSIDHNGGQYQWDKHWFSQFNLHKCPPWDLFMPRPQAGLFPPPPHPHNLTSKDYIDRYRDLIAIQTVAELNAALCDHHRNNCPPSQQLQEECGRAEALYKDTMAEVRELEHHFGCTDHYAGCTGWADGGECTKNSGFMRSHCAASCKLCTPKPKAPKPVATITQASPPQAAGKDGARAPETTAGEQPVVHAKPSDSGSSDSKHGSRKDAGNPGIDAEASPLAPKLVPRRTIPPASRSPVTTGAGVRGSGVQQPALGTNKQQSEEEGLQQAEEVQAPTHVPKHVIRAKPAKAATPSPTAAKAQEQELKAKYPTSKLQVKELIRRCYTMQGLSMPQVKECVVAASLRREYAAPADETVDHEQGQQPSKLADGGDGTAETPSDGTPDLTTVTSPSAPILRRLGSKATERRNRAKASNAGALALWLLAVVVAVVAVQQICRRSRKPKRVLRSE